MDGPTIEPPTMIPIWIKDKIMTSRKYLLMLTQSTLIKCLSVFAYMLQLSVHKSKNKCLKHRLLYWVVSVVLLGEELEREHDTILTNIKWSIICRHTLIDVRNSENKQYSTCVTIYQLTQQ